MRRSHVNLLVVDSSDFCPLICSLVDDVTHDSSKRSQLSLQVLTMAVSRTLQYKMRPMMIDKFKFLSSHLLGGSSSTYGWSKRNSWHIIGRTQLALQKTFTVPPNEQELYVLSKYQFQAEYRRTELASSLTSEGDGRKARRIQSPINHQIGKSDIQS